MEELLMLTTEVTTKDITILIFIMIAIGLFGLFKFFETVDESSKGIFFFFPNIMLAIGSGTLLTLATILILDYL